jgi:glycosyltransferase involved in cell wall biosynthesis
VGSLARVLICRSNPIAPDPRVEKIARALAAGGFAVSALGWDLTGEFPLEEQLGEIHIVRVRVKARFGRGLRNVIHQIRWQAVQLTWLFRHRQAYDMIHACDFDTVLPAWICKRLWHKKVVYDIFDFYADMLRATPHRVTEWIRSVDLWVINRVDAVILADDSRIEQIAGSHPLRCEVIYNSPADALADIDFSDRPADNRPASSCPANSRLHLAYVGNLQFERGLLTMLDVLVRHPEWTLSLAGFGGEEQQIRDLAKELPNITWYGRVPYQQALQLSAAADVLFATYDPVIPNHRYASPNKVFEAMMLGKPIIVARGTNMDRMIESAGCGLVVEYGNVEALEAALGQLQADVELRQRLGVNARRAYETRYAWSNMQKRLLKLYREI